MRISVFNAFIGQLLVRFVVLSKLNDGIDDPQVITGSIVKDPGSIVSGPV